MSNVLIVDDNDEVAEIFKELLESEGYHVERAAAAYGAALRAIKTPPDIVVMDLMLQGANGAVAALALRGLGITCPIVVVTGGLMPIDEEVYERAGFAGRLLKPVKPSELLDEIRRRIAAGQ